MKSFDDRSALESKRRSKKANKQKMTPMNYGLFLLGRRDYSVKEIRDKFTGHYANEDVEFESVIERLLELNYLDDERFLASFLRREVSKGSGPIKAQWALRQKGISASQIEIACEAVDWFEACATLVESKAHRYANDRVKFMRFLAGRGFSADQIHYSLEKLKQADL